MTYSEQRTRAADFSDDVHETAMEPRGHTKKKQAGMLARPGTAGLRAIIKAAW
jgi:hypothetical protein